MSLLPSLFLPSWLPALWASSHFHWAGFSSCSSSTMGDFVELGICCAWPLPHQGQAEVVSAKWNPSHGTRCVGDICNVIGLLPHHSKNLKRWTDQCYSSALFGKQRKCILHVWGQTGPKDAKRREARGPILAVHFICCFSSPWAYPM